MAQSAHDPRHAYHVLDEPVLLPAVFDIATRMGKISGTVRRWRDRWTLGASIVFLLALGAAAFALVAILILSAVIGSLFALGVPGMGQINLGFWVAVSGVVWLPLSVGLILPSLVRIFRGPIEELEASRRAAELARYLPKRP